jgi:microcompartment protein CcmL/EutN
MEKQSLGLIETWGLVPAIEAADVGAKAANVTLLGYQVVPVGRVVVTFVGDVAAVTAAVSSGAAAARKVGQVLAVHVIPRPDKQIHFGMPEPSPTIEEQQAEAELEIPSSIEEPKRVAEQEAPKSVDEKESAGQHEPSSLPEPKMKEQHPKSSSRRKKRSDKQEGQSPQDEPEDSENADG